MKIFVAGFTLSLMTMSGLFCLPVTWGAAEDERIPESQLDDEFGPWDGTRLLLPNENFGIKWKVSDDDLIIMLSSSLTTGWMGFGIGEPTSGSMLGADIVTTEIDATSLDTITISDRHVPWTAYPLDEGVLPYPVSDAQQDWIALGSNQTDGGTAIVLRRKLVTSDPDDRDISTETFSSILFAYGFRDIGYHGGNRGVGSIHFGSSDGRGTSTLSPDAWDSFVDVQMPNVSLPCRSSNCYVRYSIDLGEGLPDVVAVDFDTVTRPPYFTHHLLLYDCQKSTNDEWLASIKPTFYEIDQAPTTCITVAGWALGGNGLVLPPEAAFRSLRYVLLHVHYNFPANGTDVNGNPIYAGGGTTDSSGMRLFTSSKPREFAAHTMVVSTFRLPDTGIPTGHGIVHYESVCTSQCTQQLSGTLQVFATFLHMHSHGRQIWLTQKDSAGRFKQVISHTEYWNYQFQKTVISNAQIEPGDSIHVHCVYDTSKVIRSPMWTDLAEDEMCVAFLTYFSSETPTVGVCGGFFPPDVASDEGISYCNGGVMFDGAGLQKDTDKPCDRSQYGFFPLHENDGTAVLIDNPYSVCAEHSTGKTVAFVSILLGGFLVVFSYTDLWQRFKSSDRQALSKTPADTHDTTTTIGGCSNGVELLQEARRFAANHPFSNKSILIRFREHVESDPKRLIFAWLDSDTNIVRRLTRKQLWDQSRNLAYFLQTACGVQHGDRVMIVYPFGIDFLVGLVALWKLGAVVVSVYPPNPDKLRTDIPKFAHFVEDSGAKVALTTSRYRKIVQASVFLNTRWPKNLQWISSDKGYLPAPDTFQDLVPSHNSVALLQYTSGSTSEPKGVMITHANVIHQTNFLERSHLIAGGMEDSQDSVLVGWTPQFHDMGLFGSFLVFLSNGGTSYTMSPLTFLRDPPVWVKAMQRYNATCTNGPNFAYALTCKRLKHQRNNLRWTSTPRLESLKFAVMGAEPSNIRLLDAIDELMGIDKASVTNMYGLAEHTLAVSAGGSQTVYTDSHWSVGNVEFSQLVGGVEILVVDPDTLAEVGSGSEGEIWVRSQSVACGYFGGPHLTEQAFGGKLKTEPSQRYLRTGDLGFIRDNELFVVSRLKDVIIVNGKNISPTDIERTAEQSFSESIRPGCSAAFQATPDSAVLLCELREGVHKDLASDLLARKVMTTIERTVDGLKLDKVVLVKKGTVAKTSSGKVKRKAMENLWLSGNLKVVGDTGDFSGAELNRAQDLDELFRIAGVENFELSLVENGIDSMRLAELVEIAKERFGVQVSYCQASGASVNDILASLVSEAAATKLKMPFKPGFDTETAKRAVQLPFVRFLRQVTVLLVVCAAVLLSFIPSAIFIDNNFDFDSDWWIHNGRIGPMGAIGLSLWMLTYSGVCVILKWSLVGCLRSGQHLEMWSGQFTRYWTVVRLLSIWESIVGRLLSDCPLRNAFYNALGAQVSITARLHTPLQCWDLVSIGPRSDIKGYLVPRTMDWTGVFFDSISVGSNCTVGNGAIVMAGSSLEDRVVLASRTVVTPHEELARCTKWSGVPQQSDASLCVPSDSRWNTPFWTSIRGVFPFLVVTAMVSAHWAANGIVFAPPTQTFPNWLGDEPPDILVGFHVYIQEWTEKSLLLAFSYVLVHELAGLIMLGLCLVVKWLFLSPNAVDRVEPLVLLFYFPFIPKTNLHQWWQRLFGLRIGSGSRLVSGNDIAPPSLLHRIRIGKDNILFSVFCSPKPIVAGVAASLWDWVASGFKLKSPWSILKEEPDICIGDQCECAVGSCFENGVVLEDFSGTSAQTRVESNRTVKSGERVVGNPASLTLRAPNIGASPENSYSSARLESIRTLLLLMHIAYLITAVVIAVEVVTNVDLQGIDFRYHLSIQVCIMYLLIVALAIFELLFTKWILFGRASAASIPVRSYRAVVFHHMQVVFKPIDLLIMPLFGGLFPLNMYYKAMGATIDGFTGVFINSSGFIDAGDSDNVTIRSFAVMDEPSFCLGHRVDHGMLHQGKVLLNAGSTLHPTAYLMLGSLGKGSHLLPHSKSLREVHTGDGEVLIGLPATAASIVVDKYETSDSSVP